MNGKKFILLIIGIILLIISAIVNSTALSDKKALDDSADFEVVESSNEKAHLTIDSIELKKGNFYIVRNSGILYVIANNEVLDEALTEDDATYKTLFGTSEIINESMKNEIIRTYGEDEFYDEEVFEDMFGTYYLNVEKVYDIRDNTNPLRDVSSMLFEAGIAFVVIFIVFSTDFIISKIKR